MANGLQITPIRIHLSKDQSIETLRLTNQNEIPMAMQLDIKAWDQEKGEDIYTSTQDVLITPPLFTLPPKQTQVVRVVIDVNYNFSLTTIKIPIFVSFMTLIFYRFHSPFLSLAC